MTTILSYLKFQYKQVEIQVVDLTMLDLKQMI